MKNIACLLLLTLTLSGCASSGYVRTALDDAHLDLPFDSKRVTASGTWRPSEPGHGLEIYVWAEREAGDYERTLDLELDGAAKVCAALAMNDRVTEWAYINLLYHNKYNNFPGVKRDIYGVAEVIMRKETLLMLRDRKAPASEYPKHWKFVNGFKDQPDSKTLLRW